MAVSSKVKRKMKKLETSTVKPGKKKNKQNRIAQESFSSITVHGDLHVLLRYYNSNNNITHHNIYRPVAADVNARHDVAHVIASAILVYQRQRDLLYHKFKNLPDYSR